MISFCLNVIIVIEYFGHCSHLEMSVQLCISTVTLQQQSSQKIYEGHDKLYLFLFHYSYISFTVIHGSVPCSVPCFPSPYCGVQRLLFWPLTLQGLGKVWQGLCNCCKFSVKHRYHGGCSGREPLNMMMSLSSSVGASCFSSPQFSSPCCHHFSKFVCSIFPFKATILFSSLSPVPLSALKFLPVIQPWAL